MVTNMNDCPNITILFIPSIVESVIYSAMQLLRKDYLSLYGESDRINHFTPCVYAQSNKWPYYFYVARFEVVPY